MFYSYKCQNFLYTNGINSAGIGANKYVEKQYAPDCENCFATVSN